MRRCWERRGAGMSNSASGLSAAKLALAIKRFRESTPEWSLAGAEPIAITGIGCRFPGGASSPEEFWRMLQDGVDAVTQVPAERWDADRYFDANPQAAGKTNSRSGSFLNGIDRFDPILFGISPREAKSIDPQQRLLLEVTWEAIWDSGKAPEALAGTRTGVFTAILSSDYERLIFEESDTIGPNSCAGVYHSVASGRVSFLLDLLGPSVSVDTACSSSLVAIHTACQSLRNQECDFALAGGVNLHLSPEHYIGLAKLGMLSPDGKCKAFDASANGFVPGEGCGIVALKRLGDALAARDRIYAVIRGTALNQDGRTNVLTAPNGLAQRAVVRAALANGRVDPSSISYVETHGTGTPLGDPIEVEALADVLGPSTGESVPCVLGAVKTNLGHLEAAAGVAGLIKAALCLTNEEIPPNLHFRGLNPHSSLEGTRCVLPTARMPWPRGGQARYAGVSSFGFSGTNAHLILEEAPLLPTRATEAGGGSRCEALALSAKTREALEGFARLFRNRLSEDKLPLSFAEVCEGAAARYTRHEERLVVTAESREEAVTLLDDYLADRGRAGIVAGRAERGQPAPVFVFTGQGSQWPGMGVSLLGEPVFRKALQGCDEAIRTFAGWSVMEQLAAESGLSLLDRTEYAQPAIFAIQVALVRLWESWGIRPGAVLGHSVGEIAAAYVAGVLSLEQAAELVVTRGKLMDEATGHGSMAVAYLPAKAVEQELVRFDGRISIAAINSPSATVVSGDAADVAVLLAHFDTGGVSYRRMPVSYAFHSRQMDAFRGRLVEACAGFAQHPPSLPFLSTVLGRGADSADCNASYWGDNMRQPVQFAAAVEEALAMGLRSFVEVGPHAVLLSSIRECLPGADDGFTLVGSLRREQDGRKSMLGSLGTLYAAGLPVDWNAVYPRSRPPVSLPTYPYQRQRFWIDQPAAQTRGNGPHPLVGHRLQSPAFAGDVFAGEIAIPSLPYLADHRIGGETLLPMAAMLEMACFAGRESFSGGVALTEVAVTEAMVLPESGGLGCQIVVEEDRFAIYSRRDGDWICHTSGSMERLAPEQPVATAVAAEAFSLQPLPYEDFLERGLGFGHAFRTIAELRVSAGEALAEVRLNEEEESQAGRYLLHPALLDGCLQTAFAAASVDDRDLYLPFALGRIEVLRAAGSAVRVHARVKARGDSGVTADLDIVDANGRSVARIADLRLRRGNRSTASSRIYEIEWRVGERGVPAEARAGSWMIVADDQAEGALLAEELKRYPQQAIVVRCGEALPRGLAVRGVVRLAAEASREVASPALLLVQELLREFPQAPPPLWLVSREAMPAEGSNKCQNPWQASQWGLGRTIALEHPELRCVRVDLPASTQGFRALAGELANWDGEEEIALRRDSRYLPRLKRRQPRTETPERLSIADRGSFDNLRMEAIERRAPGSNELEVEVETSALNFRDTLNALGMLPGEAGLLGLEFCGRVARVGSGVASYRPGDRVMGLARGSFASYVTTHEALAMKVPADMGASAAVSIPNAFLTAYHCLAHLGGLSRGQKVLIHAATGGVGLAAVQIALRAGAEVFATAGSEEKREYLRRLGIRHLFHSRSLDFVEQIRQATGGRGVDVVLNSLAGDFIGAGFDVLADGGHFVEIGKTNIWSGEKVASLGRQLRYSVVDLGPLLDEAPELIRSHLDAVRDGLEDGSLHALPTTVFPIESASQAFRYLAQAKHIGKVVLQHRSALRIVPERTYLITGGGGAIGIRCAQWLVERGARHVVLVGRSSPSEKTARSIEGMRGAGARVEFCAGDIASREQLGEILGMVKREMPPIGGVIHSAGVLDDGILVHQTPERVAGVMAPKVAGAWNLHELLQDTPLDFFVLCSSMASVTGSPGQSGYAAGNAFLDALAHYRRTQGLAALSINWGPWSDGGMASGVSDGGTRRVLPALIPMSPEDCLETLEDAAASGIAQAAIAEVAWNRWQEAASIVAELVRRTPREAESVPVADIRAKLEGALPGARRRVLVDYLRQRTQSVLGLGEGHFIDERQPLIEIGLDSLMAVEFRNQLGSAFASQFSVTLLFDYPSLGVLADHILGVLLPATPEALDPELEAIEQLSDREAEELLRAELDG